MLQSANAELRAAVRTELSALEELCAKIEGALSGRDWDAFAEAMAQSRRVTHAMQNAMDAAAGVRDGSFDAEIYGRARRVHAIRENQLARLRSFNEAVGEKLAQIANLKRFARSIGAKEAPSRLGSLDDLR